MAESKKPTHVAVNSVQYHDKDKNVVEVSAGTQIVSSDIGDAAEIKRLEGLGAIKKIKVEAASGGSGTGTGTGSGTGSGSGSGSDK